METNVVLEGHRWREHPRLGEFLKAAVVKSQPPADSVSLRLLDIRTDFLVTSGAQIRLQVKPSEPLTNDFVDTFRRSPWCGPTNRWWDLADEDFEAIIFVEDHLLGQR